MNPFAYAKLYNDVIKDGDFQMYEYATYGSGNVFLKRKKKTLLYT